MGAPKYTDGFSVLQYQPSESEEKTRRCRRQVLWLWRCGRWARAGRPFGAPANPTRHRISFFRRQGERPPRDHQLSPTSPTQPQSHSRVMLQCAGEFGKAFRRYAAGQPTPSPSITTITQYQAKAKRQTSAGVRHLPTRSCCSFLAIPDAARGTRTYCCRP